MSEAGTVEARRAGKVGECRFCHAPLTPHQAVRGTCGRDPCEAALVQEAARSVFKRSWGVYVSTQRAAFETAAAGVAAAVGELRAEPAAIAFGAVPHQAGALVPLPPLRRAEFEEHLRQITAAAFAQDAPAPDIAKREQIEQDEHPLIGAACATCQGKCCFLGGGTDAFMTADTIRLFRHRNPGVSAEGVIAHFLGRLPEISVEFSCVFHGARGCVLTRFERADVCNRYHCNPQSDLLRRFQAMSAEAAVIVALDDDAGPSVGIFDKAGWRLLPDGQHPAVPPDQVGRAVAEAIAQVPPDLPGEGRAAAAPSGCAWCGATVDRHTAMMRRSCGRPDCERRRVADIAAQVERQGTLRQQALVRRLREAHAETLDRLGAGSGAGADAVPVGALPDGGGALRPLPAARRAAFEAHLDATIAAAWAAPLPDAAGEAGTGADVHAAGTGAAGQDGSSEPASPHPVAPEPALAGAACATCRGSCCRGGGDQGYLSEQTLLRVRKAAPGADPAAIRARYLDRVPEVSVEGSCLFHGPGGCTLRREDRSDTCNLFHCRPLADLLRQAEERMAPAALLFSAADDGTPRRAAVFDARTGALTAMPPAAETEPAGAR